MKKIILGIFTLTTVINATDLELYPEIEREFGMSGIEFSGEFINIYRERETEADKLKDIYTLINNTNDYLSRELRKDTFDKDYILRFDYDYLKAEKMGTDSFNVMFALLSEERTRIGLNLTYNDISSEYKNIDTNGEGYQVSLFWLNSELFENSYVFTNIYYGTTNEDFDRINSEYKTDYYGIYTKFEKIYEGFNDFNKGYNIEFDAKRLDDEIELRNEKNKSMRINLNGLLEKTFYITDNNILLVKTEAGYGREFLEDKVYRGIEKDDFQDNLNINLQVDLKISEVLNIYSDFELIKSLNTSDNENRIGIGVKLSI